jgi:hypothetical protein
MKRESYSVGSVSGLLGLALAAVACSEPGPTSSAGTPSSTASANGGASGDSVGAPECDEVLKKAASCKDKPGMGPILANRDQWKSGLSNASTKDATIAGCKAAMETVNAVGCDGGGVMTGTAPASSGSAGAGSSAGDSVGAPECDEVLKKAASCKDKPGMSAILSNRDNWKRGLGNTATKDATITACKAAMEGGQRRRLRRRKRSHWHQRNGLGRQGRIHLHGQRRSDHHRRHRQHRVGPGGHGKRQLQAHAQGLHHHEQRGDLRERQRAGHGRRRRDQGERHRDRGERQCAGHRQRREGERQGGSPTATPR